MVINCLFRQEIKSSHGAQLLQDVNTTIVDPRFGCVSSGMEGAKILEYLEGLVFKLL